MKEDKNRIIHNPTTEITTVWWQCRNESVSFQDIFWLLPILCYQRCEKEKHRPNTGLLLLGQVTKPGLNAQPNLIAVAVSPRSRILSQSAWNSLITSEVICGRPPHPPRGRWPYLKQSLIFSFANKFLPHPPIYKNLPFCTPHWAFLSLLDGFFPDS